LLHGCVVTHHTHRTRLRTFTYTFYTRFTRLHTVLVTHTHFGWVGWLPRAFTTVTCGWVAHTRLRCPFNVRISTGGLVTVAVARFVTVCCHHVVRCPHPPVTHIYAYAFTVTRAFGWLRCSHTRLRNHRLRLRVPTRCGYAHLYRTTPLRLFAGSAVTTVGCCLCPRLDYAHFGYAAQRVGWFNATLDLPVYRCWLVAVLVTFALPIAFSGYVLVLRSLRYTHMPAVSSYVCVPVTGCTL